MSANTTIQEGGKGYPFGPVKCLMVEGDDGQFYPWYPEADRQLDSLSVNKNGIYRASDRGVYGWNHVNVNVEQSDRVTGRDPETGQEVTVTTDPETGELVETVVPIEIRVITPPTNPYGTYVDGQTITKDGMVVKAYDANGDEMQTVPNGEITINPTTAVYDESTDTGGGVIATIDDPAYSGFNPPITAYHMLVSIDDHRFVSNTYFRNIASSPAYLVSYIRHNIGTRPSFLWLSKNSQDTVNVEAYSKRDNEEERINYRTINLSNRSTTKISGTTFYYAYGGNLGFNTEETTPVPHVLDSNVTDIVANIATILFDGTTTPIQAGSHQTITVSWPRPGGGAILETTFDILVGPRGGGGED